MDNMKLSKEKEHLVLENQPLIYYIVQKLGVTPNSSDYEDIASVGRIGLVKAAITFDLSKKIKFATYATMCIKNEIFMYYRKAKKYANDISIDEPIHAYGDGNELTLEDTLEDPDSNFLEEMCGQEEFVEFISIVLNFLKGKHRVAFLYSIADSTQMEIAKKLNLTQSYVSRIIEKSIQKVKRAANEQIHYKEVFSMAIVDDEYRISFSSNDITKFNKIFATLLQNLQSAKNLSDFKVNCNSKRILIQLPADPHSFSFIAQIIQEIDDFSMAFVSSKSQIPEDNSGEQKEEPKGTTDEQEESAQKLIIKDDKRELANVNTDNEASKSSEGKKGSMAKQVRDYMFTLDSFTVKELKHQFPEMSTENINNTLISAKRKGLITAKSRGEYVVNKN